MSPSKVEFDKGVHHIVDDKDVIQLDIHTFFDKISFIVVSISVSIYHNVVFQLLSFIYALQHAIAGILSPDQSAIFNIIININLYKLYFVHIMYYIDNNI